MGIFLSILLCAVASSTSAFAAPDRLSDDIPDAVPDHIGAWNLSYGLEVIDVEGYLNDERTAHDYFKIRYTFNPKVAASFKHSNHDLVGGLGLLNPVLDLQDSANSYTFDLALNLMNLPMTPADEENKVAFKAGSSFGIGVSGTKFTINQADLRRDETLMKAYLMYSTDLSEEMRAHTYFSSGRLSGDSHTGSVNRVGAGLDYELIPGRRPLTLMVNGVLDIYNFREPVFNTSRISRFDMGLRYRVAKDWYGNLGWVTLNDSENDSSGSGIFASVNFIPGSPQPEECVECEEEVLEPPAEGAEAAQASLPQPGNKQPVENPPLMALNTNSFDYGDSTLDRSNLTGTITSAKSANSTGSAAPETYEDNGINIPPYPGVHPVHTPSNAVMVRPNVQVATPPETTEPESVPGSVILEEPEIVAPVEPEPEPAPAAPEEPKALDPSVPVHTSGDKQVLVSSTSKPGLLAVSTASNIQTNTFNESVYLPLFDAAMEPISLDFQRTGEWFVYSYFGSPEK